MKTDEHIRTSFSDLPDDYFLFLINPNNGSNTNGHVIYLVYKEIKKRYPNIPIYYVVDRDGISEKTISQYFTQVLRLPFNEAENKKIIISKELYKSARAEAMSKLVYIYHREVFYEKPFKYSHPNSLFFPKDILRISDSQKIKIHSGKYLNTNLNEFICCGDKILQIADANNRVTLINPDNGKYEYVFNKGDIIPEALYQKYVSKSKSKIDFMKDGMKWFEENNREQLPIYNAVWDNGTIYIFFGLQALEKLENEKAISDGVGGSKKLAQGETVANLYHFIAKCDDKLNIIKIYPFKSFAFKDVDFLDAAPDIAMYFKDDVFYCFNSIDCDITEEIINSPYYKGISKYSFSKDKLVFNSIEKIPFVEDYDKKGDFLINGCITEWNEHIFVIYNTSPFIYSLAYERPIGKLSGLLQSEKNIKADSYTQNLLDETTIYVSWEYLASSIICNNSYFAVAYKHHGIPFIEIKNNRMITVQLNRLDGFPELRQGNVTFVKDSLYVWVFENDDFFFYKYSFEFI